MSEIYHSGPRKKRKYIENVENGITLYEICLPLMMAGSGMILAGIILEHLTQSKVFFNIPEIYILMPALLGLKGNLEMTMTSRLSSLANCGFLNNSHRWVIYKSNIALIQCQSIVIGFSGALFAIFVNFISNNQLKLLHIPMLCATSIITASLTSFLLASIMIMIIQWTLKFNINPDNVATPIAAALGDLVTLQILYFVATIFYTNIESLWLFQIVLIVIILAMIPLLINKAQSHSSTSSALYINCWTPMFISMLISSLSGWILSFIVFNFNEIVLYQLLVNGVGGNVAAIQASRLSSYLHMISSYEDSKEMLKKFFNDFSNLSPFAFLTRKDIHSSSAKTLLSVVVPLHLMFYIILNYLNDSSTNVLFLLFYLPSTFCQVFILLYLTGILIMKLWCHGYNPDNSAIPYLTSLGDLIGTIFLTLAFYYYQYFLKHISKFISF